MKISASQFARAFFEVCKGKNERQIEEISRQLVKTVRVMRLNRLLPRIISKIQACIAAEERVEAVTIISAHSISESAAHGIARKVGIQKARITTRVKPELIGGFIAQTSNMMYDGSISTQLKQFKYHLQS